MMKTANILLDLLLPPRCPVSGEIVNATGLLAPHIWAGLSFIEIPYCHDCGLPFSFDMGEGAICASCAGNPPVFGQARSALVYDDASRGLILAFKHGDRLESVPALVPFMMRAGGDLIAQADYLVPVPLYRWRLLRRRYNQASLLAYGIGKAAKKTVLPDSLFRTRSTPIQGHMTSGARAKNVKNAFAVREKDKARVAGKNILLIDDVYTTGATVSECAKALLKAGAAQVNVLTLARVAKGYNA